ncbi:vomeronasal type-2 receptor 26-like [Pleurodeles waltl]|uniref:vomeronasal type-2 receptor 26-like n=1 Tax=Pleurodeles waltl TaxID=8319 RepID=UPI0037095AC8
MSRKRQNKGEKQTERSRTEISHSAVTSILRDKLQFPSFLRTISGSALTNIALARLMGHFGWTWVGLIISDDEIGLQGGQAIRMGIEADGGCVAFVERIHLRYSKERVLQVAEIIQRHSVKTIIVHSAELHVKVLLEILYEHNLSRKIWVFSTSFGMSPGFFAGKAWKILNGALVLKPYTGSMPGFQGFLHHLNPSMTPGDIFIRLFWEKAFTCTWLEDKENSTNLMESVGKPGMESVPCSPDSLMDEMAISLFELNDLSYTYHSYIAVFAIAHSLNFFLSCTIEQGPFNKEVCADINDIRPWKDSYSRDGDIIIGGSFVIQSTFVSSEPTFHEEPQLVTCEGFYIRNYRAVLAMVFAIDMINRTPELLHNITLGFRIFDSCMSEMRAIQATLELLSGKKGPIPGYRCPTHPPLAGIIGETMSYLSVPMARIMGVLHYPQISHSAVTSILSDKLQFPSFLRTIPSNNLMNIALARLMRHFGWTWVGMIISDDEIGLQGGQAIRMGIEADGGCVAFMERIHLRYSRERVFQVAEIIQQHSARTIIFVGAELHVKVLLETLYVQNVNGKILVFSTSSSMSPGFFAGKSWKILNGALVLKPHTGSMPGFQGFLHHLNPSMTPGDIFIRLFWEKAFTCTWLEHKENSTNLMEPVGKPGMESVPCSPDSLMDEMATSLFELNDLSYTYHSYLAVFAIAHALHFLLSCTIVQGPFIKEACTDMNDIRPWQWSLRRPVESKLTQVERILLHTEQEIAWGPAEMALLSVARAEHLSLLEQLRCLNYAAHSVRTHASADKSDRLLAWLTRGEREYGPIVEIRSMSGIEFHTPSEIHTAFTHQYRTLYHSVVPQNQQTCAEFLSAITLPRLTAAQRSALEEPLELSEIQASIHELSAGRTPGPDGLPADFYKTFASILGPHLLRVYEDSVQGGSLPTSQNEALLVSLPKPGKDPLELGSYRPLAMLNTDYKIMGKTLAAQLAPMMPDLVLADQNGFVPTRDTSHSIRRLFHVMHYTGMSVGRMPFPRPGEGILLILHYLKHLHVKMDTGDEIFFDEHGDSPAPFDILNIQISQKEEFQAMKVGTIDPMAPEGKTITINMSAIFWSDGFSKVPRSICSESCLPGYRKAAREGEPVCCYDCIPCSQGEISIGRDAVHCLKCPNSEWPNAGHTHCTEKSIEFLSYEEPLGLTLAICSSFMVVITASVLSLFVKYQDTPIVKANNRGLSHLLLISLMLCFLCSLIFIGRPTRLTCMLRQTVFGVIFSISVSSILAKTMIVVIAFKASHPNSSARKWLGSKTPSCIIFFCSLVQVFICAVWILKSPPFPELNLKSYTEKIIFECNEGDTIFFYCMMGYMGLLATVSFIVAFLSRNLPGSFNEAKLITFSMLVFVSVWISFIPAYLSTRGKYMVAVEVFAILCSSAGLLGCIFFPKCYIILLRPDMNTRLNLMKKAHFDNRIVE